MSRRTKTILVVAAMALFGVDACLSAYTGSWGWVAAFTAMFALLGNDLYGLIWPPKPDRAKTIRPRWKL